MTDRKPGDKTIRFLGKRMRYCGFTGDWHYYKAGSCWFSIGKHENWSCDMSVNDCSVGRGRDALTAEAAIAECEAQALALFKQLGELCGKRGRE